MLETIDQVLERPAGQEEAPPFRIAILDLYDGEPNQGMRALKTLINKCEGHFDGRRLAYQIFDSRGKGELPGLDFDAYISSGGPGSPFDGQGKRWEHDYFSWLEALWNQNERHPFEKKHALFICHSFQMMARFFGFARVIERHTPSFGILPVHKTERGHSEPLFEGLADPFYAADFRSWQVVQPDPHLLESLGADILAIEKLRPHVRLERAIMATRISAEIVGVQFHPEADPPGMRVHFYKPERRKEIVRKHGEQKFYRIVNRLEDPNYLTRTYVTVVPRFLRQAIEAQRTG